MKTVNRFFPSFVLFWVAILVATAGEAAVTVTHDLQIHLEPAASRLAGEDVLTLPNPGGGPLELLLSPRATVTEIRRDGAPVFWERAADGSLRIRPQSSPTGGPIRLVVRYRAKFADPAPQAPLNTEDPSYGVALTIGPAGTFLAGSAGWYPRVPGPQARFRVRVTAPAGYRAVTAGRLVAEEVAGDRSISTWESRLPLPDLTLAAGPLVRSTSEVGRIPVYTFFSPEHASLAATYLHHAAADLEEFQQLFGPYPFAKFAVVENYFPTGYGFPSWTLLGSSIVPLPFIVTTSLAHEIAHSWWGNGVQVEMSRGNWCEGLTTYVADYRLKEQESAAAGRAYRLKILRDYATLVPPGGGYPLAAFRARRSKLDQAIGYGKSAMVFHMARQRVGDPAFWEGLRQVAAKKMFQQASWGDFARAFDPDATLGMSAFFRQWVERPGAPQLELADVHSRQQNGHWEVSGRLRQAGPVYTLQVPLRLETEAGAVEKTIWLQGRETPFRLSGIAAPRRLVADPEVNVFRRLAPEELPATVNTLRASTNLVVVATRDLDPTLRQAAADLLTGLRQSPTWREETTVSPQALAGHDLLVVGRPHNPALLAELAGHLELTPDAFRLAGQTYGEKTEVLFAALPRAREPRRTTAILFARNGEAALAAVRKIPHYGKYSYLVFRGARNLNKGTWPVTASPLIHTFPPPADRGD